MKFLRSAWLFVAVCYSVFFVLTCFSQFIPPSKFQYISFTALAFPGLLAGQIFFTISCFLIRLRTAIFCLICLLFSFFNLKNTIAFNGKHVFEKLKSPDAVRVLNWNVQNFYRNAYNKPFKLIEEYHADIVCLQDYAPNQIEDNMQRIGYKFSVFTNEGIALFSKYPIIRSETPVSDSATGEKYAVADIATSNDTIRVYSLHLQSYALFADTSGTHSRLGNYKIGFDRKRYFVKRIRDVEKIHERQVRKIREHASGSPYPVIICGDVNSVPTSYTYHKLSKGLKDAHLEKGYFLGGTYFHLFPTLRIDLCLANPRFEVLQNKVDTRKLSDHKAVITDLRFKR